MHQWLSVSLRITGGILNVVFTLLKRLTLGYLSDLILALPAPCSWQLLCSLASSNLKSLHIVFPCASNILLFTCPTLLYSPFRSPQGSLAWPLWSNQISPTEELYGRNPHRTSPGQHLYHWHINIYLCDCDICFLKWTRSFLKGRVCLFSLLWPHFLMFLLILSLHCRKSPALQADSLMTEPPGKPLDS